MTFHESNPVPAQSSQKRARVQFNDNSISKKKNSTPDIPLIIHNQNEVKIGTFNNVEEQSNYQHRFNDFGTPTNFNPTPPQQNSKK